MTPTAASPQRKPLLDAASFQQLLSAAYVLQEHNDRLRGKEVHADFAKNLSAIVETQKLIQTLQLDLEAAAKLVAERIQSITNASGAAIGILEKGELVYRAGSGTAAVDAGARVAPGDSLSADCLSQGSAVNYTDAGANPAARAKLFRERNVKSFIAVPVYHAGQVAGVLELRFVRVGSFREADLRTAELMAGLLSEAMATAARMKWKDALASERQSMLEALERIKPQLERLGAESPVEATTMPAPEVRFAASVAPRREIVQAPRNNACQVCGSIFFDHHESFCGICGSARPAESKPGDVSFRQAEVASGIGSPVVNPYGAEDHSHGNSPVGSIPSHRRGSTAAALPDSLQELIELSAIQQDATAHRERNFEKRELPKAPPAVLASAGSHPAPRTESAFFARASNSSLAATRQPSHIANQFLETLQSTPLSEAPATLLHREDGVGIVPVDLAAPSEGLQTNPWGSARKTQEWLETVDTRRGPTAKWMANQWQTRRANVYIAIAGVILLIVISGWGIRPGSTANAGNVAPVTPGRHQAPPPPKLTAFESLLVSFGLAEAPPAPVYLGNPETRVWVDVHTALYHCPGSDLFGKTSDGRLSTQREAQQDQFEPANRKPCP